MWPSGSPLANFFMRSIAVAEGLPEHSKCLDDGKPEGIRNRKEKYCQTSEQTVFGGWKFCTHTPALLALIGCQRGDNTKLKSNMDSSPTLD